MTVPPKDDAEDRWVSGDLEAGADVDEEPMPGPDARKPDSGPEEGVDSSPDEETTTER